MWLEVLLVLVTSSLFVVLYFHQSYQFWKRKGVPTVPRKFLLGNANTLLPKAFSIGTLSKTFYDEFKKSGHRFGGIYLVTEPNLVLTDPDLIRDVLSKDFQHFIDRGTYYNKKTDPLSANLVSLDGAEWKNVRVKLTPTFSSGKMRMMFEAMLVCSEYMVEAIRENLDQDLAIKEFLGKFTTDVIGSCAFGINCNSFKDPDAEFRTMGKKHFEYSLMRSIRGSIIINMPKLARKLGLGPNNPPVNDFFRKIVRETVKMRQEENIQRKDFLQILIDLKDSTNFTIDEMTAQVFIFFIAGFETSSSLMTHTLYELSKNQEIQNKARKEIQTVLAKYENKITYDGLKEMKFLSQVIDETLRLYPAVTTLNRRCTGSYTFADSNLTIEKGTMVLIPVLGLHLDPDYFPDPKKFDPERFTTENKAKLHPGVYLPFGSGPRSCIGLTFGLMQTKLGIVRVLTNFLLTESPKTKPVEFNPYVFLLQTVNPVYIRASKL